jgi:hypothetical protein
VMRALRTLAVVVGAGVLSSCQVTVDLVVANLRNRPVSIALTSTRVLLPAHTERRFRDWPDDHRLVVLAPDCARSFDLDEHYSPADDWRYSTFNNVRRFGILDNRTVRIILPDPAHSADRHAGFNGRASSDLDLTPSPLTCPSR